VRLPAADSVIWFIAGFPDRDGPAIGAKQAGDSMADAPRQRPAITRVGARLHQPAKHQFTISDRVLPRAP